MEIKISTDQMLKILYVVSFVIFIGVCIDAGSFNFNALLTLLLNPDYASYFDLSSLYEHDAGYFFVILTIMTIVGVMRAILFYLIVRILHDKKLNMAHPFNKEVGRFIFQISYLALGIGLFSHSGVNYSEWLVNQGVKMPDIQTLRLAGADVWLFMGITLLVIAHILKKGIEIQSENELTI